MTGAARVTVERRIAAAPSQVYDAWLDPDQAGRWLFRTPEGILERCEIDGRVGGRFRIDERRGEDVVRHHGEYLALERPRHLAFDFWTSLSEERSRVTVAISAEGDGSLVTLTHEGVWEDWADKTRQGWATVLDRLACALSGDSC